MRINRNDSGAPNGAPQAQPTPAAPEKKAPAEPKEPVTQEKAPAPKQKPRKSKAKKEKEADEHTGRRFPVGCLIVLIVLALVAFGGYQVMKFYGEIDGGTELGEEQTITIEQGSSVGNIATQLKDAGIIEYDWLFKQYVKYSGKAGGIQYGDFTLRSGMDYNSIIQTISQEVRRPTTNITIPEGTTAVGVAQIFVDAGLVEDVDTFLNCANGTDGSDFSQYSFWTQIPDNGRLMKCEGYLFPDTYNVYADEDVYYYVDTLYSEFAAKTEGLTDTINEKGTTLDDVVKLASFIQEEAGVETEDAKVSACFHNRLESDDPLWAEHKLESNACSYITQDVENNYLWNSPTAEYYGWPEAGAIPEEVLNAYDTYRISGLPAGPISCPGYAAIEAALNPDQQFIDEGYFFFVTGHPDTDVAGQYFYAKTADEHQVNVEKAGWAY
ncbi:MAG TPA: endolytic transglycosylase MltG [Candidatus Gemmiger excrementigallinarum]|uniref:Endolytic murein transglycosylase n=1 Tax=Candidatus Gemmiger excrementigallinarum TaxID=2838609 RepID=A0A9D2EPQ6_9FIRM|nr:endolytic transglycosylase MltG [Candidatus Gemmiger excrementigallinarum]